MPNSLGRPGRSAGTHTPCPLDGARRMGPCFPQGRLRASIDDHDLDHALELLRLPTESRIPAPQRPRSSSHAGDWRAIQSQASAIDLNWPISSIVPSSHSASTYQWLASANLDLARLEDRPGKFWNGGGHGYVPKRAASEAGLQLGMSRIWAGLKICAIQNSLDGTMQRWIMRRQHTWIPASCAPRWRRAPDAPQRRECGSRGEGFRPARPAGMWLVVQTRRRTLASIRTTSKFGAASADPRGVTPTPIRGTRVGAA